jgi:predicted CopG family antitoxin
MNTTIQITKITLEKLKKLKEFMNLSSYDELINELIRKAQDLPDSMFGIDKGKIKKFSREDRLEFREY